VISPFRRKKKRKREKTILFADGKILTKKDRNICLFTLDFVKSICAPFCQPIGSSKREGKIISIRIIAAIAEVFVFTIILLFMLQHQHLHCANNFLHQLLYFLFQTLEDYCSTICIDIPYFITAD